ncbi:MAG: DUF1800 domain-containing protein [Cephaloticoccus sp.]|nr:DUF1800 domain-containing protein [Cephaloticoccus sp.]MCF7759779.1 DUF1800 domain-containing protein [Cephaloticoccus sp.]
MNTTAADLPPLSSHQQATHALNRLGYGARPGEVDQVVQTGVENWIRRQLDPRKIPDPAADTAIAALPKLRLPASQLVAAYQAEIRARRQEREVQTATMNTNQATMTPENMPVAKGKASAEQQAARLMVGEALGELMHAKLARAVLSERQLEEVLVDFWFNHFNVDARKQQVRAVIGAYEQEVIRPHVWGNFRDLLGATAHSTAMLVYLDNFRSSRTYTPSEREKAAIKRRQNELMGEEAAKAAPTPTRGLNENYGRELLELHTLGVDAGYTQMDVQEVARAFTGWTIEPKTGDFIFRRRLHDDGAKLILGTKFAAGGGERDGERVLDLLALHPATAHHLAYQLCQRFVADNPPAAYVERVARAYLRSKGDLRATYQALFLDPEFFALQFYGAKSKSPFEFAASSLRATGAELTEVKRWPGKIPLHAVEAGAVLGRGGERLANLKRKTVLLHLVDMGQPIYGWAPPTGFSEDSSHWVGAGALVARLNFALALAGGEVPDVRVAVGPLLGGASTDDPAAAVDAMASRILAGGLSLTTRRILLEQGGTASDTEHMVVHAPRLLALLLGSPEFQRR